MSTGFFVFVRLKPGKRRRKSFWSAGPRLLQLEDVRIKEVEKFIFASRQSPFFLIQSHMNDFSRSGWKIESVLFASFGAG
jgi:hypothetical protein